MDGGEIVDHRWMRPGEALDRHSAGELELFPPTWVSLWMLARHDTVAAVIVAATELGGQPPAYLTAMVRVDGGLVGLWDGDVAYADHDIDPGRVGPRHRLWMTARPWRFKLDLPG